jgi:AmmeMemoRadiSam system protein B/AmmeMemoRadiSam system protein A
MHTLRSCFLSKKKVFLFAAFSFLAASTLCSQGIRKPVWAGLFYPKDPKALSDQIDHFLKNTKEASKITGEIKALIAPHAGYVYSGQVAAEAYRLVQGKPVDTVVILSPCHRHGFYGASIYIKGGYETPLGVVKIDEQLARELSDKTGFQYVPAAHREEHAIEVQIPFIQKTLPEAKIVPVIMGIPSQKTIKKLASALASVTYGKNVLILASTDMSHFLSKAQAKETDIRTISLIKSFQIDQLIKKLEQRENIMCGGAPAAALITENHIQPFSLSRDEKDELLRIARVSISQFLKEKKFPVFNPVNIILLTKKGAFVTLKKEGRLRGCIGFIEPIRPLYKTVIQAALYAAFQDTRFLPVTTQELNSLEIEISVLSPLEKIHDPENINVGRHGLYLLKNGRSGLLLPQVAVENGWSREMFLRQVCRKAGLPVNAWKTDSEIFIFEAVVFR